LLSKTLNSSARRPTQAGGRSLSGGTTSKEAGTSTSLGSKRKSRPRRRRSISIGPRETRNAEADAAFAIEFAYGAIGEAEYAVLDAVVVRKEADELSAS
jgi:hypothetical protein